MSETLNDSDNNTQQFQSASDDVEKKEVKVYENISSFLSAFEESEMFKTAREGRKAKLLRERPELQLSQQDLVHGLRSTSLYNRAMIDFYRAGNTIPTDLEAYDDATQEAITDYFDNLKSVGRHSDLIKFTSGDKDKQEVLLFMADKTRDRYHTLAGLTILGEGVTLSNGDRIVCDNLYPDDEDAMPLDSYTVLGRTLVTVIAEENLLDIVDPDREKKKVEATLNFLNSLHYSGGHWVGKGEN